MCKPRPLISLLVPMRPDHGRRDRTWRWLRRYWRYWLRGDAEIVVGRDWCKDRPFSKAAAVNDAARRARGDIFVIIDADAYLSYKVVKHCAERIRSARNHGVRLWFVPYRALYRLTRAASDRVLASSPKRPYRFPSPPDPADVEDTAGTGHGHLFGALAMIMPREAFETVGGMDERFRGWGGEDISFLRAVDTLWAKHRNTPNDILHLWHEKMHVGIPSKRNQWATRVWPGQARAQHNNWLATQYNAATNKPQMMRNLVEAGHPLIRYSRWRRK